MYWHLVVFNSSISHWCREHSSTFISSGILVPASSTSFSSYTKWGEEQFYCKGTMGNLTEQRAGSWQSRRSGKAVITQGGLLASPWPNLRYQGTFRCSKFTPGKVEVGLARHSVLPALSGKMEFILEYLTVLATWIDQVTCEADFTWRSLLSTWANCSDSGLSWVTGAPDCSVRLHLAPAILLSKRNV